MMVNRIKAKIIVALSTATVLVAVLVNVALIHQQAHAEPASASEILTKVQAASVARICYDLFLTELGPGTYNGTIVSILNNRNNVAGMPLGIGNTLTDSEINCNEILMGDTVWNTSKYGRMTGLLSRENVSLPSASNAKSFLESIGYEPEYFESGLTKRCLRIDYNSKANQHNYTPYVCFMVDENNMVSPENIEQAINTATGSEPVYTGISRPNGDGQACFTVSVLYDGSNYDTLDCFSAGLTFYYTDGIAWDDLVGWFERSASHVNKFNNEEVYGNYRYILNKVESTSDNVSANTDVKGYKLVGSADQMINALTGGDFKTVAETNFSYRQIYGLYVRYLTDANIFNVRIDTENCGDSRDEVSGNYAIMVNSKGEKKWCGVAEGDLSNAGKSSNYVKSGKVNGLADGSYAAVLNTPKTVYDILDYLGNMDYGQISVDHLYEIDESGRPIPPDSGDITDPTQEVSAVGDDDFCMSANSGAMGWGICPAITGLRGILAGVYGRFIVPMLEIDTSFLSTDGATYDGWTTFRNIANIFFVILILAVIFSQVTGYGIDNYGIKRILPKLIVTAILVNFSFIICQLAVDISNILGSGLKSLFYGMATSGSIGIGEATVSIGPDTSAFVASMNGLFEFLKYATLIGGGIALFMSPGSVAMAILVAFLGVAAAVLFMFASLGARTVGVIVLTVISPLAFVAYALPNTNSLFRQWWNIFKGLLLLYPICGLLVGGGQFVGTLIFQAASSQGDPATAFFYILIALLTSVLPFFALPTLLKRTMTAMGGIGTAITNAGARVRGATRRVGTSEWAKEARIRGNAGIAGGLRSRAIGKFGTKGMKRRMSGQLAARDELDKRNRLSARMLQDNYDTRSASQIASDLSLDMNEQDLSVSLDRLSSMDMKQATDWVAAQAAKLDIENNEGDYRRLQNLSRAVKNNDRLHQAMSKEEDVKRMLDNNGYIGRDRKNLLGSGGHAATFAKSANTGDYLGLSSGAQRRAISTGGLSSATKNELMNSSDPTIRSAIAGDQGKADNLDALRAGAAISEFDNTDGQASQRISEIAAQYRNTQSVNEAYAENDARNAQSRQASAAEAAQDRQARRIAEEIGNVINVPRSQSAEDAARSFGEQQQEWWDRNNNS